MDLRAGLDEEEKRKFLIVPVLELRPSVVQPVASRYTD
jgi:7,8-dihydro-6-hydroxymethylpterin-pyrophosphokinase